MSVEYTFSAGNTAQLVPAPHVSLSKQLQKNNDGTIVGTLYNITLTGKLLYNMGSPGFNPDNSTTGGATGALGAGSNPGFAGVGSIVDENYSVNFSEHSSGQLKLMMKSIQAKQAALRQLFAVEGGMLEIQPLDGSAGFKCYPRLMSIDFPAGAAISWAHICDYSIVLEADYINDPINGGDFTLSEDKNPWSIVSSSETMSFGDGEGKQFHWTYVTGPHGEVGTGGKIVSGLKAITKTYSVSREVSAQGKRRFDESTAEPLEPSPLLKKGTHWGGEAWQQASGYVFDKIGLGLPSGILASGVNALPGYYQAYNHKRNYTIDKAGGSFSVSENWLFASGQPSINNFAAVTETYGASVSKSEAGLVEVSLNGSVKGLNRLHERQAFFGGVNLRIGSDSLLSVNSPQADSSFADASGYFHSNVQPHAMEIAEALVDTNVYKPFGTLHPIPKSESYSYDPNGGSISFQYAFDTREQAFVPGVITEAINITDSAPGETIATIDVIGRKLGPVMQNVGSQTPTWSRTLNIELVVSGQYRGGTASKPVAGDYTGTSAEQAVAASKRTADAMGIYLIDRKPSNTTTPYDQRTSIQNIIKGAAPHGKPGVLKAYTTPSPSETWDPKSGRWTFSITWNYETNMSHYYD
jgi:hypothetical protein